MTPETFTEAMKDKEFSQGYLDWLHKQDELQEQSEYGVTPEKGEYDGCDRETTSR